MYGLFRTRAEHSPSNVAIVSGDERWTYGELLAAVDRLSIRLQQAGVRRGHRVAILSENRPEYLVLQLAAARTGAILACQNGRLADPELQFCIDHVTPTVIFVSSAFSSTMMRLNAGTATVVPLDGCHQDPVPGTFVDEPVDPEDPLLLLYTSGTTGRPKGALISHRAEIARMCVTRLDLGIGATDAHLAWAPMSHIGSSDLSLGALMSGGPVIVVNGFDPEAIAEVVEHHALGWLFMVPGMIEQLADVIERRGRRIKGAKVVGCMLDLVAPQLVARLSALFGAPFLNSFGMTETGMAPLSAGLVPPGVIPTDTSKHLSSLCELRLLDPAGNDVAAGETGEAAVRGPTVFSGYWNAPEANRDDFATGYFRTGDLFSRTPRGTYIFVDRAKYMIKSGGENIYPAEIERVLLADVRVVDAVVVRKKDAKWGEVPVVFIARRSDDLTHAEVESVCRRELAGYKRPKEVHFVTLAEMPRSTSGKILRHEMEKRLR